MKWIPYAVSALVGAAAIACGASANTPGDGSEKGDAGNIPVYDGGGDYFADGGDDDGSSGTSCGDLTSVENCGVCGNVCPGQDTASANAACIDGDAGPSCEFSCQGEHYDVNQDASDGCEKVDVPIQNHAVATAISLGSASCHDDSSAQILNGIMPSDDRVHETPGVIGFDSITGSAPDYWSIFGSGGTCDDDLNLTLTITGSKQPSCYTLTATMPNHGPYTCTPSTGNSCSISNGSGSYDDNSTIVWYVHRTCNAIASESVSYTVVGHL